MKVGIVGLGAIGGLFAGRLTLGLAPAQVRVCALARGATLAALQRQGGLRWKADTAEQLLPLHASADPAALGVQDLLVLSVKAPALASVLPAVQAMSGPHTQVLVAMNGVPWWFLEGLAGLPAGLQLHGLDPGGSLRAALPTSRVLGCVVHAASVVPAPGSVCPVQGRGLIIGRPSGAIDDAVQSVSSLLAAAGFDVTVSERIQRDIWFKLWGNMTMNPVSALTGATADRVLDDPLVRSFNSAAMREAQAIGAALGLPISQDPEDRHAVTRKLGAFKTSMLQDAEAGRPLELDALVGAVRELGQQLGLPTPYTDAIFGLTRLMARERGLYPS